MEQNKEQLLVALNKFVDDVNRVSDAFDTLLANDIFEAVPMLRHLSPEIFDIQRKYNDIIADDANIWAQKAIAHLANTSVEPESSE